MLRLKVKRAGTDLQCKGSKTSIETYELFNRTSKKVITINIVNVTKAIHIDICTLDSPLFVALKLFGLFLNIFNIEYYYELLV